MRYKRERISSWRSSIQAFVGASAFTNEDINTDTDLDADTPDLLDKENVKLFREWNLAYSGIGLLKFIRIAKEGGLQVPQQDGDMDMME
jgi:hypothetical protein